MDNLLREHNTYNTLDSIAVGIFAIYMIALIVLFVFYVISYVLKGIGIYTIAKRMGREYPWLAFIPFARVYLQGELSGEVQLKTKSIRNPGIPLLALPFVGGVLNVICYVIFLGVSLAGIFGGSMYDSSVGMGSGAITGMLIAGIIWVVLMMIYTAVYQGFGIVVNHQIYCRFTTRNMSILHAVFGKLLPLYESICFFVIRNRDFNPGMEPEIHVPPVTPVPPVAPILPATPELVVPPAPEAAPTPEAEPAPEVIVPPAPEAAPTPKVIVAQAPVDSVSENSKENE